MPPLTPDSVALGFIWYIAFLFSTTCHEASHALVAKLGGDETAALAGQVTLNPLPHIRREPWGMVLIPILSFVLAGRMIGWASAPFNPSWERQHPRRSAWMALAGPAANFSLMFLATIGLRFGISSGWIFSNSTSGSLSFPGEVLSAFFQLNLLLGTFNLLPVPPLDGSTAIMVFMGESTARRYLDWLRGNSYAMLGLIVALLVFREVYPYVEAVAAHVLLRSRF